MTHFRSLFCPLVLVSAAVAVTGCSSDSSGTPPGKGLPAASGLESSSATSSSGGVGFHMPSQPEQPEGTGSDESAGSGSGEEPGAGAGGNGNSASSGAPEGGTGPGTATGEPALGGSESTTAGSPSFSETGGELTFDPLITGGKGTTIDPVTGGGTSIDPPSGGGTSIDPPTGGGTSIDPPTGGGTSIDPPTGGGTSIDPPPPPPPPPPKAECIPSWFANNVNVLVLEDTRLSGADTLGGLWVGGNFTATGGYDIGKDLERDCCRYDLVVGGDTTTGGYISLMNGSAAHGGSFDAAGVSGPGAGAVSSCPPTSPSTEMSCGVYEDPPDMPNFTAIAEDVKSYSAWLAGFATTGEVNGKTLVGANPCHLDSGADVYVFNIDESNLAGLKVEVPLGSTVVINVSGTEVNFTNGKIEVPGGNCGGGGETTSTAGCTTILYNLYEAETVYVSGMEIPGSILAPYALFTGAGGHVDGQVAVRAMDTSIEFHAYFFTGCIELSGCLRKE